MSRVTGRREKYGIMTPSGRSVQDGEKDNKISDEKQWIEPSHRSLVVFSDHED